MLAAAESGGRKYGVDARIAANYRVWADRTCHALQDAKRDQIRVREAVQIIHS